MWGKSDGPPSTLKGADASEGFIDNDFRTLAYSDANQFQKRKRAQGGLMPHPGQEFRDGFDISDSRGAGTDEHLRSVLPRVAIFGDVPQALRGGDQFQPIGEKP